MRFLLVLAIANTCFLTCPIQSFASIEEIQSEILEEFAGYGGNTNSIYRIEHMRQKFWLEDLADPSRPHNLESLKKVFDLIAYSNFPNNFFNTHESQLWVWNSGFIARGATKLDLLDPEYIDSYVRKFSIRKTSPKVSHRLGLLLGKMGLKRTIPSLERVAKTIDHPARKSAIWAIRHIGGREAIDALIRVNENLRSRLCIFNNSTCVWHTEHEFSVELSTVMANIASEFCDQVLIQNH